MKKPTLFIFGMDDLLRQNLIGRFLTRGFGVFEAGYRSDFLENYKEINPDLAIFCSCKKNPGDELKVIEDLRLRTRFLPKADIVFKARKLPGYSDHFSVDVPQMITINDSFIGKDLETHGLLVSDAENCNGDMYRIYRHTRIKEANPYHYEYDNQIFGCEFFMYPYELRVLA
jgi:hypothetical protein